MLLQVIKVIHFYLLLVSPHPVPFQVTQTESSKSPGSLLGRVRVFLCTSLLLENSDEISPELSA